MVEPWNNRDLCSSEKCSFEVVLLWEWLEKLDLIEVKGARTWDINFSRVDMGWEAWCSPRSLLVLILVLALGFDVAFGAVSWLFLWFHVGRSRIPFWLVLDPGICCEWKDGKKYWENEGLMLKTVSNLNKGGKCSWWGSDVAWCSWLLLVRFSQGPSQKWVKMDAHLW